MPPSPVTERYARALCGGLLRMEQTVEALEEYFLLRCEELEAAADQLARKKSPAQVFLDKRKTNG